jgi:formylmethanofuran dehydrogenase subunit E
MESALETSTARFEHSVFLRALYFLRHRLRLEAAEAATTEMAVNQPDEERCGKCGEAIDPTRRVDFTLKDGTRVCDSCFVKGTARPPHPQNQ